MSYVYGGYGYLCICKSDKKFSAVLFLSAINAWPIVCCIAAKPSA